MASTQPSWRSGSMADGSTRHGTRGVAMARFGSGLEDLPRGALTVGCDRDSWGSSPITVSTPRSLTVRHTTSTSIRWNPVFGVLHTGATNQVGG